MTVKGIIRGKAIELDLEPGLPDGQEVSVTVEPVPPPRLPPAAGAWADHAEELDKYLEWNRQQRKPSPYNSMGGE